MDVGSLLASVRKTRGGVSHPPIARSRYVNAVARAPTARTHLRCVVRPDLHHFDRRADPQGADTRVQLGALCEIFLAITNIGTAVVLWPIVRRQSETLALSYVASRLVESVIIVVGLISLLSVVTLREDFAGAGADAGSLTAAGESLVAIHDWTFLLGPGFCVGVNGLLLGYLFYRSGLVPRWMAMLVWSAAR